jgi:hypothetical protein
MFQRILGYGKESFLGVNVFIRYRSFLIIIWLSRASRDSSEAVKAQLTVVSLLEVLELFPIPVDSRSFTQRVGEPSNQNIYTPVGGKTLQQLACR